jgi:hypothetical protein
MDAIRLIMDCDDDDEGKQQWSGGVFETAQYSAGVSPSYMEPTEKAKEIGDQLRQLLLKHEYTYENVTRHISNRLYYVQETTIVSLMASRLHRNDGTCLMTTKFLCRHWMLLPGSFCLVLL